MRPPNRHGTPVDPVPFLIAALTGAMFCLAVGPPYLLAMGVAFGPAVGASSAMAVLVTWGSYYEFVWTAGGDRAIERPAGLRLQRIGYAAVIGLGIGVGLLLPVL